MTRERAIEASGGAVQTLAQGQGQGQGLLSTAAWAEVLARQKEWCCKQKAWRLVTRPSLMAAPRHHACAVHEKETD